MESKSGKSEKIIDNWPFGVAIALATAFGVTIFVKNAYYGGIFFLILFFVLLSIKKGWFKDKIFHD
ncbi:MAG: hypothetical protein OEM21_02715 [Nitrosopumilus sp.]|nr:hypothetical protein [Nitrosopumilus sp.]